MGKNKKEQVTCRIDKIYGFLNNKCSKALVQVSWNDGPTRVEVRKCWKTDGGELRLGSGIPLESSEIEELVELFKKVPKPVNFDEVFRSTSGIMEKRDKGYRTEDGFIVLTKRMR